MRYLFECRRTFLTLMGILCLMFLSFYLKMDMSGAIAMIVMGVAGANAAQGALETKFNVSTKTTVSAKSKPIVDDPDA